MSVLFPPVVYNTDSPTIIIPSLNNPGFPSLNINGNNLLSPVGILQMPVQTLPLTLPTYLDMNVNPDTWQMMSKYYYYKTLDDWLWEDSEVKDVLNYIKVSDKSVDVLNSMSDYKESNSSKDTQSIHEMKVNFIEKHVLDVENVVKLLKKFIRETNIKWVDLGKNSYFVKDLIKRYLKQKIQYMIENKLSKK